MPRLRLPGEALLSAASPQVGCLKTQPDGGCCEQNRQSCRKQTTQGFSFGSMMNLMQQSQQGQGERKADGLPASSSKGLCRRLCAETSRVRHLKAAGGKPIQEKPEPPSTLIVIVITINSTILLMKRHAAEADRKEPKTVLKMK